MADHRDVADIANDIFDLDLDWSYSENERVLSSSELDQFSTLCTELVHALTNSRFQAAVWFLSQSRHFVGYRTSPEGECRTLELSLEQRERIRDALEASIEVAVGTELRPLPRHGPILQVIFGKPDKRVFQTLIRAEKRVLAESGLNQKSVAIVTDRLDQYSRMICRNAAFGGSVGQNTLGRSVHALQTLARRPIWRLKSRAAMGVASTNTRKKLIDAKDKVVGLTTLWADALPLLVARDWGIAGVFSTVAGATVAAVMTRGRPDDDQARY